MLDTIPDQISFTDDTLNIRWKDGKECSYNLLSLRKMCPCAMCSGGHSTKAKRVTDHIQEIQLQSFKKMGRYALSLYWSDGHDLGIYTYDSLRKACDSGLPYSPLDKDCQ